jgi:hypothetical protein
VPARRLQRLCEEDDLVGLALSRQSGIDLLRHVPGVELPGVGVENAGFGADLYTLAQFHTHTSGPAVQDNQNVQRPSPERPSPLDTAGDKRLTPRPAVWLKPEPALLDLLETPSPARFRISDFGFRISD